MATSERLAPHVDELVMVFTALIREARDGQPGAMAMMGLHTGLLLHLWRASALSSSPAALATDARGTGAKTVQRFRQLVELHYRDDLTIAHFAALVGVTRSRLHKACLSATKRTSLALIHERLIEEARLRLEQTLQPVEQVGYGLGFSGRGLLQPFLQAAHRRLTRPASAVVRGARDGRGIVIRVLAVSGSACGQAHRSSFMPPRDVTLPFNHAVDGQRRSRAKSA